MAYLDSNNVEDLVADIKDLTDATYAKIEDIPEAAISTPLPDSQAGNIGSSTKYAKEDHSHHILSFKYTETSGSFLDWCYSQFPTNQDNSINGCFYVVFETNNYTGWPVEELGTALVQRRNNDIYIIAFTSSNLIYTNKKNGGDTQWNGWKRLARTTDIPSASSSNPVQNATNASVGSSSDYARADHAHPVGYFKYTNATGSFLDWCISTFAGYGSYFVIFETGNYTGWPVAESGCALVQRRNNNFYIIVHSTSNLMYTNRYSPNAQTWYGWKQLARSDSIPTISTAVSFTCTTNTHAVERGECKGVYDPNSHIVHIEGYVSNVTNAIATSATLFTIPNDYRPSSGITVPAIHSVNSALSIYFITFGSDGTIKQSVSNNTKGVYFSTEYVI